jgi:tetratricopeptide (TPR) repeat protein
MTTDSDKKMFEDMLTKSHRGLLFDGEEEFEHLVEYLSERLRKSPGNATALNNRGLAYSHMGRPGEALADFDAAIKYDPDNPVHWINRAREELHQGNIEAAIEDMSQLILRQPGNVFFRRLRGGLQMDAGDFDGAVRSFSEAIDIDPYCADAYLNRADALARMKKLEASMRDRRRARELKE